MKKFPAFFLAGALLLPALLSAASPFEGTVTMKMTGAKGEQLPMTYSMKNGLLRVDMVAPEGKNGGKHGEKIGATIMDPIKMEMIILMDEQKMYMVKSLPKPTDAADSAMPIENGRRIVVDSDPNRSADVLGVTGGPKGPGVDLGVRRI